MSSPLIVSVERKDIKEIKSLLLDGRYKNNPNLINREVNSEGLSALLIATKYGYSDIIILLCKSGANSLPNKDGVTPAHIAAKFNQAISIHTLIDISTLDVNHLDNNGWAPLHVAAACGHFELIQILINSGAKIDQPTKLDGATPLYIAAEHGRVDAIRILLILGANVGIKTRAGMFNFAFQPKSPLDIAKEKGKTEAAQLLFREGKLLTNAVLQNDPEAVEKLLADEYNRNSLIDEEKALDGKTLRSPLDISINHGFARIITLLLNGGANVNVLDNLNRTPLYHAAQKGNPDVMRALINGGANIRLADNYGLTPLHVAASISGKARAVEAILEGHREIINLTTNDNSTALHLAAKNGKVEAIHALIRAGANINMTNNDVDTPLHAAADNGSVTAIRALLNANANINKRNGAGETPLCVAARKGNLNAVESLLARNADIKLATNDKKLPSHIANERGHARIVDLLKNHAQNFKSVAPV